MRPARPRGHDLLTSQLFVSEAKMLHCLRLMQILASFMQPCVCVCVFTGVVCGVGALRPPDSGGVTGMRAVRVRCSPASLVLLADLRQVVHAEAAQLLRDGSLTLPNTRTHTLVCHHRQYFTEDTKTQPEISDCQIVVCFSL